MPSTRQSSRHMHEGLRSDVGDWAQYTAAKVLLSMCERMIERDDTGKYE